MSEQVISKATARRYILGQQGLWPGRRWQGKDGTAQALSQAQMVQMDPLNVVARSHDLVLHSRVLDYQPNHLDRLLYEDRFCFDYGGTLFVHPMDELPFWRVIMRHRGLEPRYATFAAQNGTLLDEVRQALRERGPLGNRDFAARARVAHYRGRKDTAPALFYLWLTGELMTHHRRNFERVYDFRENIVPPAADTEATEAEAERFLIRKAIAFLGLCPARSLGALLPRPVSREEARRWVEELLAAGEITAVRCENFKEPVYASALDAPLLAQLEAGQVPGAWQPLQTTTLEEVTFLAPLEIVSARGRAKPLFDFDYIWEVYKPASARRWGYYTLPILYGDRLVARLDPKLNRATRTLAIQGFWLEDETMGNDADFAAALARGLTRLAHFTAAQHLNIDQVEPRALRHYLESQIAL